MITFELSLKRDTEVCSLLLREAMQPRNNFTPLHDCADEVVLVYFVLFSGGTRQSRPYIAQL